MKHLPLLLLLITTTGYSQSLPVGTPVLEDYYRRAQLLGKIDSSISFTSRPFFPETSLQVKNGFDPLGTLETGKDQKFDGSYTFWKNKGVVKLLPVTWQQLINTHHPYSLNDGEMIPARGYQSLFSAGLFAKLGPLSIQLQPEYVYAQNNPYDGFPLEHHSVMWYHYIDFQNKIDLPVTFGHLAYNKVFWGQSSIRLTFGAVSFGFSNENLWWGPGIRNSLLMSNTSGGFKHFTINTVKPIRTFIGTFEGQIIAGRLNGSGILMNNPKDPDNTLNLVKQKSDDWRLLNGMVISYQPKWVPGLFLGLTRSYMNYSKNLGNFPYFSNNNKKNYKSGTEIPEGGDQLQSTFIRLVLPKEHAEIYFEYGREDHSFNYRDLILEPDYARAYIFGLRKIYQLRTHTDQAIQVHLELTQLEQNRTNAERNIIYFYTHSDVRHGYTNKGQLLGAGIGPGSNMQSISISWFKSFKMVGLQLERYVHNNDFHYLIIRDIRANWVDIGAAILGEYDYGHLLFKAKAELVKSYNYQHLFVPISSDTSTIWIPGKDTYNFQGQLSVSYRF